MLETMSDNPEEASAASSIEVTNILLPSGEKKGPVHFQYTDSVSETIENLVGEFGLSGDAGDYRLYVTDSDNKTTALEGESQVEEYDRLLQSYTHIELTNGDPHLPDQPELGLVPRGASAQQ